MKEYIAETAEKERTSEAEVLRRSVEAFRVLNEIRHSDGELVFRRKDGTLERLVRF